MEKTGKSACIAGGKDEKEIEVQMGLYNEGIKKCEK